jgi:hypothetical protein
VVQSAQEQDAADRARDGRWRHVAALTDRSYCRYARGLGAHEWQRVTDAHPVVMIHFTYLKRARNGVGRLNVLIGNVRIAKSSDGSNNLGRWAQAEAKPAGNVAKANCMKSIEERNCGLSFAPIPTATLSYFICHNQSSSLPE